MKKHNLALDIPDTMLPCVFIVNDISQYDNDDPYLCCPMLEITLPGFSTPVVFNTENSDISFNFHKYFTACDLGLQKEDCSDKLCSFPDGIYIVRYSISPNDVVYVEYNHLRITEAMNRYKNTLCCIDVNRNTLGFDHAKLMMMLSDFRTYIDAAKAMVEICHKPAEGMALYNYALSILDKINCNYC